jgi:carbon storage regulator
MLTLTRLPGQKIHIGDDIVVTVIEIRGDKCRIGIDAPKNIVVDREEVSIRRKNDRRSC